MYLPIYLPVYLHAFPSLTKYITTNYTCMSYLVSPYSLFSLPVITLPLHITFITSLFIKHLLLILHSLFTCHHFSLSFSFSISNYLPIFTSLPFNPSTSLPFLPSYIISELSIILSPLHPSLPLYLSLYSIKLPDIFFSIFYPFLSSLLLTFKPSNLPVYLNHLKYSSLDHLSSPPHPHTCLPTFLLTCSSFKIISQVKHGH